MTPSPSRVVLLIGLRGAGKTTLGRALAERCSMGFQDLDDVALELCEESTVGEVFDRRGESAWRAAEASAFIRALENRNLVLALGGGAPMVDSIKRSIQEIKPTGHITVIWLDAPDEVLAARIGLHGDARPALLCDEGGEDLDALEECRQLRSVRGPTFEQLADMVIDTDGPGPIVLERLADVLGH